MSPSAEGRKSRAIILHPLADLSRAWPAFFVYNLLASFTSGTGKSGSKFRSLRDLLVKSLPTAPSPGPATFVVNCLQALTNVTPPYAEGLSHLLLSALSKSEKSNWFLDDACTACKLAASLFYNVLTGKVQMESRIVAKLPAVFKIELKDLDSAMDLEQYEHEKSGKAKELLECYVRRLLKSRSYTGAVALLKSFNLQRNDYETLVAAIADDGQINLAVEWAAHLGIDMLKFLVSHCIKIGLFKVAYRTTQQYNLEKDFPDVYYLYKQSTLRKLVRKGLWDVAESIAEEDSLLVEFLLNLASAANEVEKVAELCERFEFDKSRIISDSGSKSEKQCYLQLGHLMPAEKVYWIDDTEGLLFAEKQLISVKLVGIDCEWKANRTRGAGPNKVSILQMASSESVYVFDLLTLSKKHSKYLNSFIKAVFHTPAILKLGYAVHNDLEKLLHSYREIEAFQICESVLDLQRVFGKETMRGGLSGLAKSVLGNSLDKQIRMSDWECRPLSSKQLHYAALDAAVLLPIYKSITSSMMQSPKIRERDLKKFMMSFKVTARHMKESSDPSYEHDGVADDKGILGRRCSLVHSHEDLVLETCELLGIPIPGLLKAELVQFTQTAKLSPPLYTTISCSFRETAAYLGSVKVAGTTFSGKLFSSKKDAEFSAAQVALTTLSRGLSKLESRLSIPELQQKKLQILRFCNDKSLMGCAGIKQTLENHKHDCIKRGSSLKSCRSLQPSFLRAGQYLLNFC